jgi:hypothetical protein
MDEKQQAALNSLREPFPENQVSKLPKETKKQAEMRKAQQDKGEWPSKCDVCGGLHHPKAVHLDYVGHAAVTDRLLSADLAWFYEPVAVDENGLPVFDKTGGLWIRLTVAGVSRLGYGHAASKPYMDEGSREKEVIGDAIRNAAMRFGVALDLWHKGDLHVDVDTPTITKKVDQGPALTDTDLRIIEGIAASETLADLSFFWKSREAEIKASKNKDILSAEKDKKKASFEAINNFNAG